MPEPNFYIEHTLNTLAWLSSGKISLILGMGWWLPLKTLFRSFGSRQTLMVPFGFLMMTILDNQGIGSGTGVRIWRESSRSNSSLRAVLRASGTLLGGWTTGLAIGSIWRWHGLLSFPVPWNTSGNWSASISFVKGSLWGLASSERIFSNCTCIRSICCIASPPSRGLLCSFRTTNSVQYALSVDLVVLALSDYALIALV